MPYKVFDQIKELHNSIPIGDEETAWDRYHSISLSLDHAPNASDYEKGCLERVNRNLAEAIRQKMTMGIGPALAGLQTSLEKRTYGPDGYPIRR